MILAEYVGFYSARYKNDPPYQNFLRRLKDSPETSTYQNVPDGISRIDEGKFVLDMEGQFLLVFKNLAIFLPTHPIAQNQFALVRRSFLEALSINS